MEFEKHFGEAAAAGASFIFTDLTGHVQDAIATIITYFTGVIAFLEEEIKTEMLKGAANLGKVAASQAIIRFIQEQIKTLDRAHYLDHDHKPEEVLEVVEPEAELAPESSGPHFSGAAEVVFTPGKVDERTPENPGKQSQAGPTYQVDRESGEVRPLVDEFSAPPPIAGGDWAGITAEDLVQSGAAYVLEDEVDG